MKLINSQKLVLASKSPRRKALLEQLGIDILISPSRIDEKQIQVTAPETYAQHLARLKAEKTAERFPHSYVLGADTIVVLEDQILGKPTTEHHAFEMLNMLNGREHQVYTGFCLLNQMNATCVSRTIITDVQFKQCTDDELRWYIETKEPFGKAGAYAIQGIGAFMVKSITGSYSNVVGLPVCEVVQEMFKINLIQL